MNRAWTHIPSLLALTLLVNAADGQQKPASPERPVAVVDPLRVVLEKKGYVAVPLIKDADMERFTIDCKSGTEVFRLDLDTGAETSSLDMTVVKKLGVKQGDEVKSAGIGGLQKGFEVSIRGLSLGDFDTRTMANALPLRSVDHFSLNAERKDRLVKGLLGNGAMSLTSAVIDYSARMLYLRTPLNGLMPDIKGRWVATGGQEEGRERKIDPKVAPRLEFKDNRFHLTDGANQYVFGVHVRPEMDRYTLVFFDPEQELANELGYKAGGLLKAVDGKLSVCLCLHPAKAKEFPDDFKAAAGSGHLFLEFRREKPAERPVAVADPLRAALEKKGYIAVPLTEEEGRNAYFIECKCGTEKLRLVLDTGAEVSVLDTSLAQKFGLKAKRDLTVLGTGGKKEGVEVSLRGLTIGNFDTRTTGNVFPLVAVDFTDSNKALAQHRKLKPIDGLFGHCDLENYSAVIDYSTATLYLRAPLEGLWPTIEGRWVATGIQEDDRERPLDPKAPLRLEFKDNRFHLTDGTVDLNFGMHVRVDKGGYAVVFFDPPQELDTELNYKASGLLKVANGKLTACLSLGSATSKGIPDEFKAPAGSGRLLVEFRRDK